MLNFISNCTPLYLAQAASYVFITFLPYVSILVLVSVQDQPLADSRFLVAVAIWLSGSALVSINEVTLRQSRLVLGWVTGPCFNCRHRKPISVYNQPPRSTQPGHPSVGRRNEYQPKGGDALRLGSKRRYGS